MKEHAYDPCCTEVSNTVCELESAYYYGRSGVLIRQAQLDGALQKIVPTLLRALILYLKHYTVFAGPSGERQLFDTLQHR